MKTEKDRQTERTMKGQTDRHNDRQKRQRDKERQVGRETERKRTKSV